MLLSGLYFLARVTGLVQSTLLFALLPPGAADAYLAAFTLPDYLNYVVASGTLSLSFIPIFTRAWDRGDEESAWKFFSTLACLMGGALVVLTLVLILAARPLVLVLNPGFGAPERVATLELAVAMTRVILPAQLFFYFGGLMIAVLNSFKRFSATGWTGALYNVVAVLVAVPFFLATRDPLVFAWGILVGAFVGNFLLPLAALMLGPHTQRPRFKWSLDLSLSPVRRYFWLTLPIIFSISIATADVWVWRYFASLEGEGALRNINAAYRLMIAAQGLLGQAAAVAAFPFLASRVALGEFSEFAEFLRTGLRRLLFITLGASLPLIVGAMPLARLVYGYGQFDNEAALHETAACFAFFSVGLWAWAAQALVARGFYAMGDTRTPVWTGTLCTLGLALLCGLLLPAFGLVGLALATTLGVATYLVVILLLLERKLTREHGVSLGLHRIGGTVLRVLMACAVAGVVGLLALRVALPVIAHDRVGDLGLALWTCGWTAGLFLLCAQWFKIPEWKWLRAKFGR